MTTPNVAPDPNPEPVTADTTGEETTPQADSPAAQAAGARFQEQTGSAQDEESAEDGPDSEIKELISNLKSDKTEPIGAASTLIDVNARVCTVCGAMYDRTEPYCHYAHGDAPTGDETPLYTYDNGGQDEQPASVVPADQGLPPQEQPELESGPQVEEPPQVSSGEQSLPDKGE